MKLVYPTLQASILLSTEYVNSVIIEEPGYFHEIVQDLKGQCNGVDGKAVLSKNNEIIEISKNVELVIDYFNFDVNQKALLTKVISVLEKVSNSADYFEKSQKLLADIERYILDLSFGFDIELQCDKISIAQVLKSAGIRIISGHGKLTEILYVYMELIREFIGDKIFIFVNLHSFVGKEELQIFADTALAHKYCILFLDNFAYPSLSREHRLIVDQDLCEIEI